MWVSGKEGFKPCFKENSLQHTGLAGGKVINVPMDSIE
jgi:hypothetical protein